MSDTTHDTTPHEPGTTLGDAATGDAETGDAETTVIFGADWCGDCRRAKLIFDRAGAPYRYIDLVSDPAAIEVAKDISGRSNIPVILYADGSHQVEPSNADMQHKIHELGLGHALRSGTPESNE